MSNKQQSLNSAHPIRIDLHGQAPPVQRPVSIGWNEELVTGDHDLPSGSGKRRGGQHNLVREVVREAEAARAPAQHMLTITVGAAS